MAIEGVLNSTALPLTPQVARSEEAKGSGQGHAPAEDKVLQADGRRTSSSAISKMAEQIIEKLSKDLDPSSVGREYRVYDKLGKIYIRIYDKESGEMIREIPPEQLIEMAKKMQEIAGLIFNHTV